MKDALRREPRGSILPIHIDASGVISHESPVRRRHSQIPIRPVHPAPAHQARSHSSQYPPFVTKPATDKKLSSKITLENQAPYDLPKRALVNRPPIHGAARPFVAKESWLGNVHCFYRFALHRLTRVRAAGLKSVALLSE